MFLSRWFKRQRWVLVKTLSADIYVLKDYSRQKEKVFYHLFESDRSNRKVEISFSVNKTKKLTDFAKTYDVYQEKIYRWLNGRRDPEIPRYDQI